MNWCASCLLFLYCYVQFGIPHPSARTFLNWLQQCQHRVQIRGIQLLAGRAVTKRKPAYRRLDQKIADAKVQFSLRTGMIFANMFPTPQGIPPQVWAAVDIEISSYLSYVEHLIGNWTVEWTFWNVRNAYAVTVSDYQSFSLHWYLFFNLWENCISLCTNLDSSLRWT